MQPSSCSATTRKPRSSAKRFSKWRATRSGPGSGLGVRLVLLVVLGQMLGPGLGLGLGLGLPTVRRQRPPTPTSHTTVHPHTRSAPFRTAYTRSARRCARSSSLARSSSGPTNPTLGATTLVASSSRGRNEAPSTTGPLTSDGLVPAVPGKAKGAANAPLANGWVPVVLSLDTQ